MQGGRREELAPIRTTFRTVLRTVVPEAGRLDAGAWAEVEALVEEALLARPAALRRRLRLFARLLEWLPVFRWGRPFSALSPGRRARLLTLLEDAPLLSLRQGFWGLRTLALLGYYGRPSAARSLGYRARPGGRSVRGPEAGEGAGELLPETPRTVSPPAGDVGS